MDELIMDWSLTTPSIANNLDEARTAAFTTKNYEVLHFFSQFLENIYLVHLGLAWTDNSIVSRQEVSHFYHFKCQTQLMFKWLSGLQWLHQVEWTEAWREEIWRDWCSGSSTDWLHLVESRIQSTSSWFSITMAENGIGVICCCQMPPRNL